MLLSFELSHLYISLAVLCVILLGLWARGKTASYLFFAAVFGLYLIGVVSVVLFPIHIPEKGAELTGRLQFNLIPFQFGRCDFLPLCLRLVYQNILLTVPFGFGVHFISKIERKNILWLAVTVGLAFEWIQLIVSLVVRSPFRVVDINDVILNAFGVLVGYGIFRVFGWLYLFVMQRFKIQNKSLFTYMYDVVRRFSDT